MAAEEEGGRARCCELAAGNTTEVVSGSATIEGMLLVEVEGAESPRACCRRAERREVSRAQAEVTARVVLTVMLLNIPVAPLVRSS